MRVKFELIGRKEQGLMSCDELDMGDLAVIVGGNFEGRAIIRTYSGMTQLSDHKNSRGTTWDSIAIAAHKCRPLLAGEAVTLTVEEGR